MMMNQLRRRERHRRYLGLREIDPQEEKDFFKDSETIYMGTKDHWDNLDDPHDPENWRGFDFPTEFNMLIYSQAGYRKSTGIVQNLIPYFYKKGYKVCIFEAKNADYSFGLQKKGNYNRIYPEAYCMKFLTHSCLPSFLVTPQKNKAEVVPPEQVKKFTEKVTIFASSLDEQRDWERLFSMNEAGAEHLHNINLLCDGDIVKIRQKISRGYNDSNGEYIKIHYGTQATLLRKFNLLVSGDNFLNEARLKEIDLEKAWTNDKIVTIPFYSQHPEYMSIYAKLVIDREIAYLKRHPGQKVLNIWEDCQLFLDKQSDKNNPGKERIKISMRLDRKQGINNMFVIQDAWDFTTEIMNSCNMFMIGFVYETDTLRFPMEVKQELKEMQERIKEYKEGGIMKRSVPYMFIPSNYMKRFVFYPQDPCCGTY